MEDRYLKAPFDDHRTDVDRVWVHRRRTGVCVDCHGEWVDRCAVVI